MIEGIRFWSGCGTNSFTHFKGFAKIFKTSILQNQPYWLLLVLDENSRRQFSILINDSDLRKIDLHETSKRTLGLLLLFLFQQRILFWMFKYVNAKVVYCKGLTLLTHWWGTLVFNGLIGYHYLKNIQIWSFFWPVPFLIRTEFCDLLHIQSECRKIQAIKISACGPFLHNSQCLLVPGFQPSVCKLDPSKKSIAKNRFNETRDNTEKICRDQRLHFLKSHYKLILLGKKRTKINFKFRYNKKIQYLDISTKIISEMLVTLKWFFFEKLKRSVEFVKICLNKSVDLCKFSIFLEKVGVTDVLHEKNCKKKNMAICQNFSEYYHSTSQYHYNHRTINYCPMLFFEKVWTN